VSDVAAGKEVPPPTEVMRTLRERALTLAATECGVQPTPELPRVWGVILDMGFDKALVTLVALTDGTTSLYTGTGGGVIGAGGHATVRKATADLLAVAEANLDKLAVIQSFPFPAVGEVRFYARTFTDTRGAGAADSTLASPEHPLFPLFRAAQAVITAVRQQATKR
jgi:hypothetical protein